MISLLTDGDKFERETYDNFLKDLFPAYELFWQKFIVPLTNRPTNIYTKSDEELKSQFGSETTEQIHERVSILQLHYSVLRMLVRAFDAFELADTDVGAVGDCFSYLCSALDISTELIGRYDRFKNGATIMDSAFNPQTAIKNALNIRRSWEKKYPYPADIKEVREYRNLMLHGQMFACEVTPAAQFLMIPRLGVEKQYLDWRTVFGR